jgi:hypothetical protein
VIRIRITTDEGEQVVDTRPWTISQWELRNKVKVSQLDTVGVSMTDLMWLAWRQLTDDGAVTVSFEQFGPRLVRCEVDDEPANPTNPAPPGT